MSKVIVWLLCLLCAFAPAAAQEGLTPELADAKARSVQALHVMSQRDEAFEGLIYNNRFLTAAGCQPVSIANGLIAAFGVQDRQTAVELVKETAQVLVVPWERGKGRMELDRIRNLLSAQERLSEAQEFPYLAEVIGGYAGEIAVLDEKLTAELAGDYFAGRQAGVLVGGMQVSPSWIGLLEIMQQLYDMDMKDAVVCLASVGVGTEPAETPLGSGNGGHYLTVMMHVDDFVEEGRIYVLDSLPRALMGEESGYTLVLRRPYPFAKKKWGFSEQFNAARIRDTVIELSIARKDEWQRASLAEKDKMLRPLILYGPGVLTIACENKGE